ncbi:MAG: 2-oxo acid dehydrogenase subunit E2 [Clostridia bacterium]
MATIVTMPRYGANMTEGTVAAWFVAEGETVTAETVIGEIAIEKLANELKAGVAGVVLKLIAAEGDELECGAPIAIIGIAGEEISKLLSNETVISTSPEVIATAPNTTNIEATAIPAGAVNVEMPRYGANMTEGTVATWLVSDGDKVTKGEPIAEIAIEKLANELLAPATGIITLVAAEGDELPCGELIAIIAAAGINLASIQQGKVNAVAAGVPQSATTEVEAAEIAVAKPLAEIKITPKAASLAEELKIDYSKVIGSGIEGAITREDIRNFVASGKTVEKTAVSKETSTTTQISSIIADAKATPKAAKLAEELKVDFHYIKGTGFFNMVTREDVRKFVSAGGMNKVITSGSVASLAVFQPEAKEVRMTEMQKMIAIKMLESMTKTAQTTMSRDIDVTNLVRAYKNSKADFTAAGLKLSYTVYLIKALAIAVVKHPEFRTTIKDEKFFVTTDQINIGFATDVEGGLMVPNIKAAHTKSLKQIAVELTDLAAKAKNGTLTKEEMTSGTMSLTNLGALGIKYFTPVINYPESAILGIGSMSQQPVMENGGLFFKDIMTFNLTIDHRIINGAPAARFLNTIAELLASPEAWT